MKRTLTLIDLDEMKFQTFLTFSFVAHTILKNNQPASPALASPKVKQKVSLEVPFSTMNSNALNDREQQTSIRAIVFIKLFC